MMKQSADLFDWSIAFKRDQLGEFYYANGVVRGHPKIMDTHHIHTSEILKIYRSGADFIIETVNTFYRAPISRIDLGNFRIGTNPSHYFRLFACLQQFFDEESFKKGYSGLKDIREDDALAMGIKARDIRELLDIASIIHASEVLVSSVPDNTIKIILSDDSGYYLKNFLANVKGKTFSRKKPSIHSGLIQDSFLLKKSEYYDICYFIEENTIVFYSFFIRKGLKVFIKNEGSTDLYFRNFCLDEESLHRSDPETYILPPNKEIEYSAEKIDLQIF